MAKKNNNSILEDQRKERQEFLELKKMRQGEIETPPKPSEEAIVPKTPKEKLANFWYQYKWYVIAITAIVITLSILITQCARDTKYDLEVAYYSYTAVSDERTDKIADYLAKYAHDLNGDGKVNVQVINLSYSKSSNDTQLEYSRKSKLQTLLAADQNVLLYITDDESYQFFEKLQSEQGIFLDEPYKLGEDFYDFNNSGESGNLPEGLQISCRRIDDTVLEKKKDIKKVFDESNSIIDSLKN